MSRLESSCRHTAAIRGGLLLSLLLLLVTACTPCAASEGGTGAYWPGYRSFTTGVVPAKHGLYLRNDVLVYSADAANVVMNGFEVEHVSVDVVADIIEPTYVFPRKLLNANHAAMIAIPLVRLKQSGTIAGTNIMPSDSRTGLGDIVISPFFLGWQKGNLRYNTNVAIFIPTGSYDIRRVVNMGRNYWTFDPEIGVTYLSPVTGWEMSSALGYSINTRNKATDYSSGDVLHLDYAIGKMLNNNLKAGLVGYAWRQVTPDTGSGALLGSFKSRVYAIGPGLQWRSARGPEMRLRYYHEFGARHHLEGDQLVLTLRMTF